MTASILASLLLLAAPEPADLPAAPAEEAAAPAPAPAPAVSTTAPELQLPRAGLEPGALAAPAVLLVGLGAAAWVLRKRRRPGARRVEVLETTSLGPKRSLVVARFDGRLLLLGASEAGIQLLQEGAGAAPAPEELAPAPAPAPAREPAAGLAGLVTRLRHARPAARPPARFDALLAESAEDQELRRKLARGQRGSVR